MLFKYTLIGLLIITTSCASKIENDYANELTDCLEESDVNMLNEACRVFEGQLKSKYPDLELSMAYKTYIQEIGTMQIPPQFFKTKECSDLVKSLKASKVFYKVWVALPTAEEMNDIKVITEEGETPPPPPPSNINIYTLNQNGDYVNCIISESSNNDIKEVFKTMQELPGMSPNLISSAMRMSWDDDDYDEPLNRLIITISFYCEMGLMFEQIELN